VSKIPINQISRLCEEHQFTSAIFLGFKRNGSPGDISATPYGDNVRSYAMTESLIQVIVKRLPELIEEAARNP